MHGGGAEASLCPPPPRRAPAVLPWLPATDVRVTEITCWDVGSTRAGIFLPVCPSVSPYLLASSLTHGRHSETLAAEGLLPSVGEWGVGGGVTLNTKDSDMPWGWGRRELATKSLSAGCVGDLPFSSKNGG